MTRRILRIAVLPPLLLAALATAGRADDPVTLALVIDRSGSLSTADLVRVRELSGSVFQSLPRGSEAAVFVFDDQSQLVRPLTSKAEDVASALEEVRTTGRYTALHDALYDASRYLRDSGRGRRAILLVTDGKDENSALVLEDGLRVAQDTGIPVFAVGVGRVEERTLRRIAKLTAGRYLPIGEARGDGLAALMAASAAVPVQPPPTLRPAPRPRAADASPAAAPAPPSAETGRPSRALAAVLIVAALAAVAAALLLRRKSAAVRCARCGSALDSSLSACASCHPEEEERGEPITEMVSETVVARMNVTEEYLEKTVTLRERPVLVVTRGHGAGQVVPLSAQSTTSIGRARANDVVLDDVSVSSQHCRVRPEEGRFVLHDLKSTNGTFVNERRVTRHSLAEGDRIKVGETALQFRMEHRSD